MNFSSNIDLDELLSYFLSGSFFIALSAVGHPDRVMALLEMIHPFNDMALASIIIFVVFFCAALMLGHLFSVLIRCIGRPLINLLLGDPRQAVLPAVEGCTSQRASADFFSNEFREAFADKYKKVFKADISEMPRVAVPRLVRSHVFHKSESAIRTRERILRARSFCAHMAVSCIAVSFVNIPEFHIGAHMVLWSAAILLIIKQRSLDLRESKEIYTHFIIV